jgi:hypothetical protein
MSAVIASPTRRRSMMKLRHVLIIWGIHLFDKGCLTKVFSIWYQLEIIVREKACREQMEESNNKSN